MDTQENHSFYEHKINKDYYNYDNFIKNIVGTKEESHEEGNKTPNHCDRPPHRESKTRCSKDGDYSNCNVVIYSTQIITFRQSQLETIR